jgi:hypothetical protein
MGMRMQAHGKRGIVKMGSGEKVAFCYGRLGGRAETLSSGWNDSSSEPDWWMPDILGTPDILTLLSRVNNFTIFYIFLYLLEYLTIILNI